MLLHKIEDMLKLLLITACTALLVCSITALPSDAEIEALLDLNTNNANGSLSDWNLGNKSQVCSWKGISCDDQRLKVISIQLHNTFLSLEHTPRLGQLLHLERLVLSLNILEGRIPWTEICSCKSLKHLDLSDNLNLNGTLPFRIGELKNLEYLDLSGNSLQGTIPRELGNCTKLKLLDFSENHLNGTIPPDLFQLSTMSILDVSRNELSGQLPPFLFGPFLFTLSVASNRLQGDLPDDYFSNTTEFLTMLDMSDNSFTGSIPKSLCDQSWLLVFSISYNKLTGGIPGCISNLTSLNLLDLSHNNLHGELPPDLSRLSGFKIASAASFNNVNPTGLDLGVNGARRHYQMQENTAALVTIDISDNHLGGEVPAELGDLVGIMYLNLSFNSFTGEIPSNLGSKLQQLMYLDLRFNQLQGTVPVSLCVPQQLAILNVSYNNLSGSVPTCNSMNTKYPGAFEGNQMSICLQQTCASTSPPPDPPVVGLGGFHESWWSKTVSPEAFYLGLAIGFCTALWLISQNMLKQPELLQND